MNKGIVFGIVVLIICVSLTPIISGSSKQVKNNEVLKPLNGYSRIYEINSIFLETISSYKKSLDKLNEYIEKIK